MTYAAHTVSAAGVDYEVFPRGPVSGVEFVTTKMQTLAKRFGCRRRNQPLVEDWTR
jgi:hypothetical protein